MLLTRKIPIVVASTWWITGRKIRSGLSPYRGEFQYPLVNGTVRKLMSRYASPTKAPDATEKPASPHALPGLLMTSAVHFAFWIGVGNGLHRPLPPNPVCSFPATGSPVSCFRIGIGALIGGLRTS